MSGSMAVKSCEEITTSAPSSRAARTARARRSMCPRSSPTVGSSNNMILGSIARTRAIMSRCC